MSALNLQPKKSPLRILTVISSSLFSLVLYFGLHEAYAETPPAEIEQEMVGPVKSTQGSFLVVLRPAASAASLDVNQLLYEGVPESFQQKQRAQKLQTFAQVDKDLRTLLIATPSSKKVRPYPVLLSYVIEVENVAQAEVYLQKIATQQKAILAVDRFYPAEAELDVSPNALALRTDADPIGDNWWSGEISMAPVNVAVLDDGLDNTHPMIAIAARKFYCQPATDPNNPICGQDLASAHGTSMTGIFASTFEKYSGIATLPGSSTVRKPGPIYNFLIAKAGPETVEGREGSLEGLNWLMTADEHPLPDVINYSQGNGMICPDETTECDPKIYTTFSMVIDDIVDSNGVTFVKSAGNKNYNAQKTTVTVPGDAYNVIAIGNLNPFDWDRCTVRGGERDHFKIHTSSSVAPTYAQLDNQQARRLVHVVAPGRNINTTGINPKFCKDRCASDPDVPACEKSCDSLGKPAEGFDPEHYGYWRSSTGTSPSAPMVGSVAAFLHASGIRYPAAIKAVIINGADSWTSDNKPHPVSADATKPPVCSDPNAAAHKRVSGTHYDRTYGWGVLNAANAFEQRENVHIETIRTGEVKTYTGKLKDFEKATLVWQKHAGFDLTRLSFKLFYEKKDEWVLLTSDDSLLDNVKQVSNGNTKIAPKDAKHFKLEIRPIGPVSAPGEVQIFALATAQTFKPE